MKNLNYYIPLVAFFIFVIFGIGKLYGFFAGLDSNVYEFFSTIQTSGFTFFFSLLTLLFDTVTFVGLSAALFAYLFYKKRIKDLKFAFISLVGGSIIGSVLKMAFMQSRPLSYFIQETGYSFPSGHAIKSTLFLLTLLYVFRRELKDKKNIFFSVSSAIVFLVCLSRLYLGVHWFSDVLAGCVFAIGWVSLIDLLREK